ncbi:MAG: hypothetical protein Q4C08_00160 [Pseudomonadota bacterium]|nr:hypothetical protein [Pseudomonadota bacterium]
MRKLTAGIFSVLLGLVSAGVADAAVVSTEYLSDVLETELADMQTKMTATGPVKIENNVVSVETGAVSEQGTNLVTAAGIYAAVNAAVADQQVKANLVKTDANGAVVAPAAGAENDMYPSYAAAVKIAKNEVGILTGGVATLQGDVSTLKTNVADIKDTIGGLGDGVTVESALGTKADKTALAATDAKVAANESAIAAINNADTGVLKTAQNYADSKVSELAAGAVKTNADEIAAEKTAREAADTQLQGKIDLKANATDVTGVTYSGTNYLNEQTGLKAATIKLDAQVKANADTIAILEGGENAEGSIKNLTAQINDNKAAIALLNDTAATVGSVENSIQEALGGLDVADGATTGQFVTAVSQENGVITVSRAALNASDIPTLSIEKVDGLQAALDEKQVSLTGQEGVIVIADGVVSIAAKGIGTNQLADGAVTAEKMAKDSVTSNAIADNAVTAGKIATDAVTAGTIADDAVVAGNLAANAVVEGNIAAGAVKNDNISDGELSVTKVNGLQDSLNAKFEVPAYTTTTQNGTYVLTATELDGKVTYAWENIAGRTE